MHLLLIIPHANHNDVKSNGIVCVFKGGSSDVSTHCSLQENEAPQGFDILPCVDTGWSTDGNRKQRQDREIDALQRRYFESWRYIYIE